MAKLSKKNVINLGFSSTGPLMQHIIIKEYLIKVKPKKIIWFYYEGNDLEDLAQAKYNKILNNYLKDNNFSQDLINKVELIDNQLEKIINEKFINFQIVDRSINMSFNLKSFFLLTKYKRNSIKYRYFFFFAQGKKASN